MKLSDINIPQRLIAQYPLQTRDECRLFCINKTNESFSHNLFSYIKSLINSGDLLILNDTKVFNARIFARKQTGGLVELLLLSQSSLKPNEWQTMISGKNIKIGTKIFVGQSKIPVDVLDDYENGVFLISFNTERDILDFTNKEGVLPLPPYIKRQASHNDYSMYQTVFAKKIGSVASPTAALHFTPVLIDELIQKGVSLEYLTLHVGYGTFSIVRDINNHVMHKEEYEVNPDLEDKIKKCKKAGNKVWAVGTTVVRTLESAFNHKYELLNKKSSTNLFIKPDYEFKIVDALITNFHHPQTTLIYLVAAFAGIDNTINAYNEAIKNEYRFLSYGDSMCVF